ncbi:phosphopantetheine-binding protein [Lentzea alba]|uniref:phosphopantetheine-binding protein n=1 Tax=Lentzea alba TaxID=2714351 RepID=UPI0039BFB2F4
MPSFSSPAHVLLALVSARTGRPVAVLTAELELTADLRLDSLARVELLTALRTRLPGLPEISVADVCEFRTLGEWQAALEGRPHPTRHVLATVPATHPGLRTANLRGRLVITDDGRRTAHEIRENLAAQGIAATVVEEVPYGASGVIFLGGLRDDVSNVHAEALHAAREPRSVFVTVQDTGGDFGQNGGAATRAKAGGLAGLARHLRTEWPDSTVRALDVPRGQNAARHITTELLHGGADQAVGYLDGARRELVTEQTPLPDPDGTTHNVIVATGASLSLLALARELKPKIVLLGHPEAADPHPTARDEAAVKRAILNHTKDLSPARVIELAGEVLAGRGLRAYRDLLAEAGAEARVAGVDDLDTVRVEWGQITGIVHNACAAPTSALQATLAATSADPITKVCVLLASPDDRTHAMNNETLGCLATARGWSTTTAGDDEAFVREFLTKGAVQQAPAPEERVFRAEVPPTDLPGESHSPLTWLIEWFVAASGATALRDVSLLRDPCTGSGPITVRGRGKRLALVSDVTHGRATIAEALPPKRVQDAPTVTVRGVRDLGWPLEHSRTDPAAVDECLRLAANWGRKAFGGTAVATSVREVRVHRTGLLSAPGKVVVSAGRVQDGTALCDVLLMDHDGSARVDLLGVRLLRHPR